MENIQLKNIKHTEWASHETHCYTASLYWQGHRIGAVGNDGHGGCDWADVTNKRLWAEMLEWIKAQPGIVCDFEDPNTGEPAVLDASPDIICADLVSDFLITKDVKRIMAKKVLFTKAGEKGLYATKGARNAAEREHWVSQISQREDTGVVLNSLPIDDAVKIYRAEA